MSVRFFMLVGMRCKSYLKVWFCICVTCSIITYVILGRKSLRCQRRFRQGNQELERSHFYQDESVLCSTRSNGSENIQHRHSRKCGVNGLLNPWNGRIKKVWMLFVVKSSIRNVQLRYFARIRWGAVKSIKHASFATVFLLPRASMGEQSLLEKESDLYGDILQCDFENSDQIETLKVLSGFRWIMSVKLSYEHVSIIEETSVMNIAKIFAYFLRSEHKDDVVCGYRLGYHRSEKQVNFNESLLNADLRFCHRAMWSVTPQILEKLYCAAEDGGSADVFSGDAGVTGFLRHKAGIEEDRIVKAEIYDHDQHRAIGVELMYFGTSMKLMHSRSIGFIRKLTESEYVAVYFGKERLHFNLEDIKFQFPDQRKYFNIYNQWNELFYINQSTWN